MLAILPVRDGLLPAGGLETVAECGGRAIVIGTGTVAAAALLNGVATEVEAIEAGPFAPAMWAAFIADHYHRDPQHVLPASPDGRDLAPRLAAELDRDLHAGAIAVTPDLVQLARHGGLSIVDVHVRAPFVATLQPGVRGVEIDATRPAPALIEIVGPAPDRTAVADTGIARADATVVEVLEPDVTTMDLAEAPRILGGGAGLQTAEKFAELSELAARLEGSMGATRVITDRGWVGHDRQIGTTGVVVDPVLYIAFGISGAVQHTSGLGQPAHIISVNTDPHCPMMQLADLAVVSDANEVLSELVARVTPAVVRG